MSTFEEDDDIGGMGSAEEGGLGPADEDEDVLGGTDVGDRAAGAFDDAEEATDEEGGDSW